MHVCVCEKYTCLYISVCACACVCLHALDVNLKKRDVPKTIPVLHHHASECSCRQCDSSLLEVSRFLTWGGFLSTQVTKFSSKPLCQGDVCIVCFRTHRNCSLNNLRRIFVFLLLPESQGLPIRYPGMSTVHFSSLLPRSSIEFYRLSSFTLRYACASTSIHTPWKSYICRNPSIHDSTCSVLLLPASSKCGNALICTS